MNEAYLFNNLLKWSDTCWKLTLKTFEKLYGSENLEKTRLLVDILQIQVSDDADVD